MPARILWGGQTSDVSFWSFQTSSGWWWLISSMFLTRTSCHETTHANGYYGAWSGWAVSVSVLPLTIWVTWCTLACQTFSNFVPRYFDSWIMDSFPCSAFLRTIFLIHFFSGRSIKFYMNDQKSWKLYIYIYTHTYTHRCNTFNKAITEVWDVYKTYRLQFCDFCLLLSS